VVLAISISWFVLSSRKQNLFFWKFFSN